MEPLIEHGPEHESGAKPLVGWTAGFVLFVLAVTGAVDAIAPAPRPRPIGEEAATMRRLEAERRIGDGTYARWFEGDLELRSRVRSWSAPYWSALLMRFAGAVPDEVVLGSSGWLFLRSRVELPPRVRSASLERGAVALHAISRRFGLHGVRFVAVSVPRKAVACGDRLPGHFAPDSAYEADLVAAMRRRGVEAVDLLDAWDELTPEEVYLPLDSHWAAGAQDELVAVLEERLRNSLPPGPVDLRCESTFEPARVGLLDFAGIGRTHPARAIVGVGTERRARLDAASRSASSTTGSEVSAAFVGSSFTASHDVADLLAAALDVPVHERGAKGTGLFGPLANLIVREGAFPLPDVLVYEFPVHTVFAGPAAPAAFLGLFFAGLESPALVPVDPADVASAKRSASGSFDFKPGCLPGSGDGVLHIELQVDHRSATRWRVECGPSRIGVRVEAGESRVVLPVLDPSCGRRRLRVVPLDAGARAAEAQVRFLTDVDPAHARPLRRGVETSVEPLDVLSVRLESPSLTLDVHAVGQDADGARIERRWRADASLSRYALFSLAPFEGGVLTSVEVEGPAGPVRVELLPAARP